MNNNYHKSLISLLLLAAMLAGTISCGGTADTPEETPQTDESESVQTETTSELDARKAIDDELPDEDFEGAVFTILTYDQCKSDVYSEEANGEVINDAVYERNQTVSERFNTEIEVNSLATNSEVTNFINTTVMAGD